MTPPIVSMTLADLTVPPPAAGPADWNSDGVAIWPGMLDGTYNRTRIADYLEEWAGANGPMDIDGGILRARRAGGWADCTPYMRHPALAALVCHPMIAMSLESLIGEPAGVHLCLTGLVSTERDWHSDTYLNPPHVGDAYAAVWIALGDVAADSGPFQYVPGSHRWPQTTREIMGAHVDLADPAWPKHSETVLSPAVEAEIAARGAQVVSYLPSAGDVLIWHPRLYHRGSRAARPGAYRPGLIAHYSGITARRDMPAAVRHEAGGWYFPIHESGPVR